MTAGRAGAENATVPTTRNWAAIDPPAYDYEGAVPWNWHFVSGLEATLELVSCRQLQAIRL
jgi:hypothetical protein